MSVCIVVDLSDDEVVIIIIVITVFGVVIVSMVIICIARIYSTTYRYPVAALQRSAIGTRLDPSALNSRRFYRPPFYWGPESIPFAEPS